jgi:hypothetical protein
MIFFVIRIIWRWSEYEGFSWPSLVSILLVCFFIHWIWNDPEIDVAYKQEKAEQAQRDIEYRKPWVYSTTPDGCTIYAFNSKDTNYTHFFTKCPNASTTTSSTIHEGKSSTRQEVITDQ